MVAAEEGEGEEEEEERVAAAAAEGRTENALIWQKRKPLEITLSEWNW